MSILRLFDSFNTDHRTEEEKDTYMSRKDAFKKLSSITKKAALSAIPLGAITAMPNVAFAKMQVTGPLNFALTLEHLEYRFYETALEAGVVPAEARDVFQIIREHELAHVRLLQDVISSLGEEPVAEPEFDFTAGGIFPDPFSNYQIFLALSQGFEDTGVRAYKGQAPNLMENNEILEAALRIHSVEARHASQVRRMRGKKGWITREDYNGIEGFEAATAAIYAGEMNTTHLGIDATSVTNVPDLAVEEAFDEPLSMEAVLNIVRPFIVS